MNKKNIGFGVFLIVAGLLFFLVQRGIFSWSVFMVFFNNIELTISLILIVSGINLLLKKYPFVKTVTWLAFFSVMIGYGYYSDRNMGKDSVEKSILSNNQTYAIENTDITEKGELKLKTSALSLVVGSTESNLIDGLAKDVNLEHKVDYKNDKKSVNVKLETDDKKVVGNFLQNLLTTGEISIDRKLDLNLNTDIIWDLDMKIDAVESSMDLTDLKVKKLELDGDAGSFKLYLGRKYNDTKVKIDADASKVEVFVPVESGVRVSVDGAASSTNFKDIEIEKDGKYYISKNYDEAVNKIDLNVDIDAGSLKIIGVK